MNNLTLSYVISPRKRRETSTKYPYHAGCPIHLFHLRRHMRRPRARLDSTPHHNCCAFCGAHHPYCRLLPAFSTGGVFGRQHRTFRHFCPSLGGVAPCSACHARSAAYLPPVYYPVSSFILRTNASPQVPKCLPPTGNANTKPCSHPCGYCFSLHLACIWRIWIYCPLLFWTAS